MSTQDQAEKGFSIEAQKDRLINYCKAKSWNIHNIYIDGGFSGSNIDRPAMKKMLSELSNIDVVLVYKLDRLSRSQKDTLFLIEEEFLKHNVDFVSLQESFDTTTPFGRAMIGILSVFAQLERETIKERSMLGREKRAESGLWRGGHNVPTGYKYIPEDNELIVDEYEAIQIREIFALYNEGKGYNNIARTMNEKGYSKNSGTKWYVNAVKRIVSNPIYKGHMIFDGEIYLGNHEPIISEELFDKTQEYMTRRTRNTSKHGKHLLGGLVWCGYCGARLKPNTVTRNKYNKVDRYFICYSKTNQIHMIKDPNCPAINHRMEKVESFIIEQMKNRKIDSEKVLSNYQHINNDTVDKNVVEKKIKDIEKQIEKVMDLYQFNNIPAEDISKRIEKLHNEKTKLLETLKNNKPEVKTYISKEELLYYIDNFDMIWKEASNEEKQIILKTFIDKIIITNKNIDIKWTI